MLYDVLNSVIVGNYKCSTEDWDWYHKWEGRLEVQDHESLPLGSNGCSLAHVVASRYDWSRIETLFVYLRAASKHS